MDNKRRLGNVCIECGSDTGGHPSKKLCTECKLIKVPCGCGCGRPMFKYIQSRGIRMSRVIPGHQNIKDAQYLGQTERKHMKRVTVIKYKGGRCWNCDVAYDGKNGPIFTFHHRDPSEKSFGLHNCDRALKKLLAEADKCDLLCSNCHKLEHAEEY